MSRTVVLIRHCKSDWDGSTGDHDRPLNPRGQRAAPRIGRFLADQDILPDVVLCSDALRTRQTWAGIADQLPNPPQAKLSHALYLAEPEAMLNALNATDGDTIAMVAHNPGIAALAWELTNRAPADDRFASYPSGATTVLRFEDEIAPGMGQLLHFTTPRDLSDPR